MSASDTSLKKDKPKYKIGDLVLYKLESGYYFHITGIHDNVYEYTIYNMKNNTTRKLTYSIKRLEKETKRITLEELNTLKATLL